MDANLEPERAEKLTPDITTEVGCEEGSADTPEAGVGLETVAIEMPVVMLELSEGFERFPLPYDKWVILVTRFTRLHNKLK